MKPFVLATIFILLGSTAYAQSSVPQGGSGSDSVAVPQIAHTNSVGATLASNSDDYSIGSPIRFSFVVTNHSKSKVHYEFSTGQLYDFIISDNSGAEVWRWSKSRVFGQLITHLNLAPDMSVEYAVTWNQRDDNDKPVLAGTYSALAVLLPMERLQVSGNLFSDPDHDPVNTGVPMMGPVESGAVSAKNTTPGVYAKTTFKIGSS